MELRVSISRYYLQEAQYMDRVRSRVGLSIAAYHESGESKYGRKVLSALDSFATPRDKPEELRHDLALLRALEQQLDVKATPRSDIPDGDAAELAVCLADEVDVLHGAVAEAKAAIAALEKRKKYGGADLPLPAP